MYTQVLVIMQYIIYKLYVYSQTYGSKGVVLHLYKVESPSPKDALCQVWLKLAQWFCRKCEKFTDRRASANDRQKSSYELSAQVSQNG